EEGDRLRAHRPETARRVRDAGAEPPGDDAGKDPHGQAATPAELVTGGEPASDDEVVPVLDPVEEPLGLHRLVLPVAVELDDPVVAVAGGVAEAGSERTAHPEVVGQAEDRGAGVTGVVDRR